MTKHIFAICIFLTALSCAAIAQQPAVTVASGTDAEKLIQSSKVPVVIQFDAGWCGPCRMITPDLESLAGAMSGRVKIVKVNVDNDPALASKYEIMSIPTLVMVKGGAVVSRQVGAAPKDKLGQWIRASY
jgi:thioredoxin 1